MSVNIDNENGLSQYVTFSLAHELFGIDVKKIHEIIGMIEITPIPDRPDFIKGVIDLRGIVIPVIDLRIKLKIKTDESITQPVIIVSEVFGKTIGMVVDSVSDVISFNKSEIQTSEELSCDMKKDYVQGIVKIDGKLVIILNLDNIMSNEEHKLLEKD